MVIDMEKEEEKFEVSKRRLQMAYKRVLEVFEELAEKGVTEAELMLATQSAFQARIIAVYITNLLKFAQEEEEEGESYAS